MKWAIMNDGKHRSTKESYAYMWHIHKNKQSKHIPTTVWTITKAHEAKVTKTKEILPFGPLMLTRKIRKNG